MKENTESEILNFIKKTESALSMRNYRDCLKAAIDGYGLANSINNESHEKLFLAYLRTASRELYEQTSLRSIDSSNTKKYCSFCRTKKKDLVLGLDVSICRDCISEMHDSIIAKS